MNKTLFVAVALSSVILVGFFLGETIVAEQKSKLLTDKIKIAELEAHVQNDVELAKAVEIERQVVYLQVWNDAYTQAAIDTFFKVPQVIVQRDDGKLSVWKKSQSFEDTNKLEEEVGLIPEKLPTPAKKKR